MPKIYKIGITQRVDIIDKYHESRDALDQRLINWVRSSGNIPIPIPNSLVSISPNNQLQPDLELWLKNVNIDTFILSGGNDIGKAINRDVTEKYLLSWAEKHSKPVLGICRGMQMMAVYFGKELIEVNGHVNTYHELKIKNHNNQLPLSVNSFHNFALEECPDNFEVIAESNDGVIKAIKHETLFWEGWMWHPERETPFNEIDLIRFKKLIKKNA
jgi:putative glutamine amidotransferase